MEQTRVCPNCGRNLPVTEYYRNKNKANGLSTYCKECSRAFQRAYVARKFQTSKPTQAIATPVFSTDCDKDNFRAWKLITAALYMLFSKNKRNDKIAVYTIAEISRVLSISDRKVNEFMEWIRDYAATNGEIQSPEIIYAKANEYIKEEGDYHRKRNLKAKFLNMRNELLKAGYTADEINEMQKI